ncbi:uncharacterized protein G2W53_026925 [Senna tora]|uniref:Uncharacterized protein n=1 Tax=Senna tora TaxID=362788 RepID=A0A834TID7_9FABA|nr:uncharacterized protein G2W53_026925 [Senna tora]
MDDGVDRRRYICSDKMIPMIEGSFPRSFKAIRVSCSAVDHVDRRPSKITESWVNSFSMQTLRCICGVKMKPRTQENLPRSFKAIRLSRGPIFDGRRRGSPSIMTFKNQSHKGQLFFHGKSQVHMTQGSLPRSLMAIRLDKMIPMTQGSLPRIFNAIRVGRPTIDHVDRHPSGINESWVNFFSMQNPTCICRVKMTPMTQGNIPRCFKAIRLARGQIFDGRRRGSPSVSDAKKSITHSQNDFYATRKTPKKFQDDPSRSSGGRPRGSPSIKN